MMRVRYLGSMYPGGVHGPGGVVFAEPGVEGVVPDEWGASMIEAGQFEAVKAKKKSTEDLPADGDEPEGSNN